MGSRLTHGSRSIPLVLLTLFACRDASIASDPAATAPATAGQAATSELVAVEVRGLRAEAAGGGPVLFLGPPDGERVLPIWIGSNEALAIALALEDVPPPRPMTHDLAIDLLAAADVAITQVTITKLEDSTFHAVVTIRSGDRTIDVDARPSDATALALRADAPIRVHRAVLDRAAIDIGGGLASDAGPGGLHLQELTEPLRRALGVAPTRAGVLVAEVEVASAAARAGLRPGDVILTVAGVDVRTVRGAEEAVAAAGSRLALTVARGDELLEIQLNLD